jgi:6-pyruvoyl-tetrahydropterin synthase
MKGEARALIAQNVERILKELGYSDVHKLKEAILKVVDKLESEGLIKVPAETPSPELAEVIEAVERIIKNVAAQLERKMEEKIDVSKEEIKEHEVEIIKELARGIGKSEGRIRADIEISERRIIDKIREAKEAVVREQQDLAYISSRRW